MTSPKLLPFRGFVSACSWAQGALSFSTFVYCTADHQAISIHLQCKVISRHLCLPRRWIYLGSSRFTPEKLSNDELLEKLSSQPLSRQIIPGSFSSVENLQKQWAKLLAPQERRCLPLGNGCLSSGASGKQWWCLTFPQRKKNVFGGPADPGAPAEVLKSPLL